MILQYPDPILLKKSRPVELPSDLPKVKELAEEMVPYVTKEGGFGLAAVQLSVPIRLIGIRYGIEALFLINPEIIWRSGKTYPSYEGCLSIKFGKECYTVVRDRIVKVRGLRLNQDFEPDRVATYKVRDILSRAVQHEVDHLDGKLICFGKGGATSDGKDKPCLGLTK